MAVDTGPLQPQSHGSEPSCSPAPDANPWAAPLFDADGLRSYRDARLRRRKRQPWIAQLCGALMPFACAAFGLYLSIIDKVREPAKRRDSRRSRSCSHW